MTSSSASSSRESWRAMSSGCGVLKLGSLLGMVALSTSDAPPLGPAVRLGVFMNWRARSGLGLPPGKLPLKGSALSAMFVSDA
eukprot:211267-Chlamydomonas_euryale.AAC.2